jgi:hypothetical protein
MAKTQPAENPSAFGILPAHFKAISEFVASKGYVIALRTGKPAAVHWIAQGLPAKPLELKIKIDRTLGVLVARNAEERAEAWRSGRPVLEAVSVRPPVFVARGRDGSDAFPNVQFHANLKPWAHNGVVLDVPTRQAITSDYDLAAIVDARHFDYNTTYASSADGKNRTNLWVEAISADLNTRFGSRRIMHGSEAQYSGSLAHDDDEEVLIFHPRGEVEHVGPMPKLDTDLILHKIILRYFPDRAHVFRH